MTLAELRARIDKVDERIVRLLDERARLARCIGEQKREKQAHVFSPGREKYVLDRAVKRSSGQMPELALRTIFREILAASRSLQKPLTVGYLGPPATFTHMAVLQTFGSTVSTVPLRSIADIFRQVEAGLADYGVVPIENSTEGTVTHTLDMFVQMEVKICAECYLPISHHLLSRGTIGKIKVVYSNPQALAQCQRTLANLLSGDVELREVSSTSHAAQIAARDREAAAVASALAAKMYKLKVLAEHVEDHPRNRTRFLVIGRQEPEPSGRDKTSIMFSVPHRAGALFEALKPFHAHKVNLTMIESRPTRQKLWEYVFFIDALGYMTDPGISQALKELEKVAIFVKVLGSYPLSD